MLYIVNATYLTQLINNTLLTMEARRQWEDIVKKLKEKNHKPRILYPAKLYFKNGEIKTFPNKQKQNLSLTHPH